MMKTTNNTKTKNNKTFYFGFLLIGISMLVFNDYLLSASSIMLSIIFFPYDTDTPWPQKSFLMKSVIFSHLFIAVIIALSTLL